MQPKLAEEMTLFSSVIKWTFYASIVGVLVGGGTTVFLLSLSWASQQAGRYTLYYLFLPLIVLASSALVRWLAPDAAGHGTEKVIEAVHKRMGKIPLAVVPVKLVATVLTIAGGGSAGKEGPCAQIGAGLASMFADLLKVDDADRRKLVICGISAGFATVFGTPIAGAIFGVEVLVLGQLFSDVLFPSVVAGIVGYNIALALGVQYTFTTTCTVPEITGWGFITIVTMGLWCGLIALFLIECMKFSHKAFDRLGWHWTFRAMLGGALVAAIGGLVSPSYLGLGVATIESGFRGELIPAGAFFWKSLATSITLGSGGSGGVVTPIFFVGTAAGNLFAQLINEPNIATFSAIGMVALLAGAANTPIAATIMAMELFGPQIASQAGIACMVSFLMVGYRSIYPSQVLGAQKSRSLTAPTGNAIGELSCPAVSLRDKSLVGIIMRGIKLLRQKCDNQNKD
jgi:H+/Cl- antiporter ClcA